MKTKPVTYLVLLLPSREIVVRGCSLHEASAWMRTYNDVMRPSGAQAVIAEERPEPASVSRPRAA